MQKKIIIAMDDKYFINIAYLPTLPVHKCGEVGRMQVSNIPLNVGILIAQKKKGHNVNHLFQWPLLNQKTKKHYGHSTKLYPLWTQVKVHFCMT